MNKPTPKITRVLLKPLKFSRLTIIISGIVLSFFIFFFILNIINLINLNSQLKKDFAIFQKDTNQKITAITNSINNANSDNPFVYPSGAEGDLNISSSSNSLSSDNAPIQAPSSNGSDSLANNSNAPSNPNIVRGVSNSFGDHFSGLSFIDRSRLTMNWDENSTAFTFPPLYNFEKIGGGTSPADFLNSPGFTPYLKVVNNKLYYRGQLISLPSELAAENILNIKVNLIGKRWLVGIVSGKNTDERGWVYFFDGENKIFYPLITNATSKRIEPKYGRSGGTISFGGNTDNFLIVYGGYDGQAFYYYNGELTDVSRLLGLRVSDGGFIPQIISAENSRGTVFYLCSATEGKPKFIKFWPNQAGELMGSLDFTPLIFSNSLGAVSAACKIDEGSANSRAGNNQVSYGLKVLINIRKSDNNFETWRFGDNGFDNSRDREVVSFDIGQNRGRKITSAIISSIDFSNSDVELFFANANNNWQKVKPYEWIIFDKPTDSLFWRATFKAQPGQPDYSPWFGHINSLDYKTN